MTSRQPRLMSAPRAVEGRRNHRAQNGGADQFRSNHGRDVQQQNVVDSPFDTSGIQVGADGVRRYEGLPRNIVAMLRTTVERFGDRRAVVELDGASVTYAEL